MTKSLAVGLIDTGTMRDIATGLLTRSMKYLVVMPLSIELKNMPQDCKHYWVLEGPTGTMTKGICKKCEAVDFFFNAHSQRGDSNLSGNVSDMSRGGASTGYTSIGGVAYRTIDIPLQLEILGEVAITP